MAPIGAEVAPLVGATVAFLGSSPDEWDELERVCLDGYLRGLRSTGWDGTDEEVRFGYAATLVLRFGLGALPAIIGLSMFTEDKSSVRLAFGCTFEEFVKNCGAATRFLCERVRRGDREREPSDMTGLACAIFTGLRWDARADVEPSCSRQPTCRSELCQGQPASPRISHLGLG